LVGQIFDILDSDSLYRAKIFTSPNLCLGGFRSGTKWEKMGLFGLYDSERSGRPSSLSPNDEEFIKDLIAQEPRSMKKIQAKVEEKKNKKISQSTIRRFLKNGKFRWKRIRKPLKSKRNEEKFRKAQEKIQNLEKRRQKGEIDVCYFDEAGFSTDPVVPYAW
jgi:transposase